MKKHIQLLGIFHLVLSGMALFFALMVFAILFGIGWISQDETALGVLTTIGVLVATFMTLVSVPGIIAGIGLLKFQYWARILALIVGCLELLNFPLGTALGVYTLWVLLNDEAIALLAHTD
jgi:hypothetical protein